MKIRPLAVLPVLALGCLSLTACDTKVGTAAVVRGNKISEGDLASYLTPNAKPVQASDGSSTPARTFVLRVLLQNQVYPLLLAAGGKSVSEAKLDASKATILQGANEQLLTQQITASGLKAKFEPVYIRNLELSTAIRDQLTSAADQKKALDGVKNTVTVNPRYGSWDAGALSLTDLGKKQLPSVLSFDGSLPGDVKAPTTGQ